MAPLGRLIPRRPAGYGLHVPAGLGEALDLEGDESDLGHLRLLFGRLNGYDEGVAEALCTVALHGQVHKGKKKCSKGLAR